MKKKMDYTVQTAIISENEDRNTGDLLWIKWPQEMFFSQYFSFLISTIAPMPHGIHVPFICHTPYTSAIESTLQNALYFTGYTTRGQQGMSEQKRINLF